MFGGGDSEELPEIAKRLGQFKSEEAYLQFRAQWDQAKQSAAARDHFRPHQQSSSRCGFAARLTRWLFWRPRP